MPFAAERRDVDDVGRYAVAVPARRKGAAVPVEERLVEARLARAGEHVVRKDAGEQRPHAVGAVSEAPWSRARQRRGDARRRQRMDDEHVVVPPERAQRGGPDPERSSPVPEAQPRRRPAWLACLLIGDQVRERAATARRQPGEGRRRPSAMHRSAQRARCDRQSDGEQIARPWGILRGQHRVRARRARGHEQLVATDTGQHRAAARRLDQGQMEMGVERPEESVTVHRPPGVRTRRVELVGELEPQPVREAQVGDDPLLPRCFIAGGSVQEAIRGRDRVQQPFPARKRRRDREHGRGVASAREADEAWRPAKRREDRLLERMKRRETRGLRGQRRRPPIATEDETAGELEVAEPDGSVTRAVGPRGIR